MSFTRFLGGGGGQTQGFSRFLQQDQSASDPYDTTKLQTQIDNANIRIQDAGYKPQDGDRRNWFEKLTNLPQKQNWFFDTLDLLGRPGQAVLNVMDKVHDGTENPLQAAWKGFSGQERVRGSEIVQNAGINNGAAKFILGTGLEIAADPLTYIPGGVIAKGAKASAGLAAAPVRTAYRALEEASPTLRNFRETQVAPRAEAAKDALGYMFKPGYKQTETLDGAQSDVLKELARETENSRRFMGDEYLKTVTSAAKSAGLDTGTEVGRIMEQPLRQFEDVKGYEFPDGMRRTENRQDLMDEIVKQRGEIKGIGKELKGVDTEYKTSIGQFADGLNATDREIQKMYFGLERQIGKDLDSATRGNLRDATKELRRLDSQINNFDSVQESYLKNFEKEVAEAHAMNFDLIKRVREVAPSGIKGISKKEMPKGIVVRTGGKGIDEVADELGYKYADDLVQELKVLKDVPQRLDKDTLRRMAQQEYQRVGADEYLSQTFKGLVQAKQTVMDSLKEISIQAKKPDTAKISEMAFSSLAENPRYKELSAQRDVLRGQLDALKGESKQVRQEKIEQIKQIESEIEAHRESLRNPVMMQKELPRPVRDMPTDPAIRSAAQTLIQSNDAIRQLAKDKGIQIAELEGYMTHILSVEERNLRKVNKPRSVDGGARNTGNPNKSILNQRQYTGSVEDINDRVGRKVFEPNAFFASAVGQQRLVDYIHAVDFRRQVLSNSDFARPFVKGMDIPKNAEVIDSNQYTFLKDAGDTLDGVVPTEQIGGKYVVTKAAKQLLDRYQHINTDEGTKAFLKALGSVQGAWKKLALFSPAFHVRNVAGSAWNMYAAGMNPIAIGKYVGESAADWTRAAKGTEEAMLREFRQQGLGAGGLTQSEYGQMFKDPAEVITKQVERGSQTKMQQAKSAVLNPFDTSRRIGEKSDEVMKYAMFKWARANGKSPAEAADAVKEALFDYSELTPFERKARLLIPFYSWSRKNIPFQVQQFITEPRKYANLNKIRLNAQDAVGIEESNQPDYMKETLSIPVYGQDGKGKMLGLNLPAGDLTKLSNPLKLASDAITPLIKTPIELAANYNLFRGKPIQKFEGQEKQYQIPGTGLEFGIPIRTAYALEQATGQIGRNASEFLQKPESVDQDNKFRAPSFGISSMVKDFDAEKNAYFQKLAELKQLQDLMLYIQQQEGAKPRTLAEIKKGAQ